MHIQDMFFLNSRNADMFEVFIKGHFVVYTNVFSTIAMNQTHEQENMKIKINIRLTEKPNTQHRWIVAGPEVPHALSDFENNFHDTVREHILTSFLYSTSWTRP